MRIGATEDDEELGKLLKSAYTAFNIDIPWGNDIEAFMSNPNSKLVFS
jgi:hypothetical protein